MDDTIDDIIESVVWPIERQVEQELTDVMERIKEGDLRDATRVRVRFVASAQLIEALARLDRMLDVTVTREPAVERVRTFMSIVRSGSNTS